MNSWYDRETEIIEGEYDRGELTRKEFFQALRDLDEQLRGCAEDAAQEAYNNTVGH